MDKRSSIWMWATILCALASLDDTQAQSISTENPSDSEDRQDEDIERLKDTLANLMVWLWAASVFILLLMICTVWFCCSLRDTARRQYIQEKVNESDIRLLRQYINKLEERLDLGSIWRIPTTVFVEKRPQNPVVKAIDHLRNRVSRIVGADPSSGREPPLVIQDESNVYVGSRPRTNTIIVDREEVPINPRDEVIRPKTQKPPVKRKIPSVFFSELPPEIRQTLLSPVIENLHVEESPPNPTNPSSPSPTVTVDMARPLSSPPDGTPGSFPGVFMERKVGPAGGIISFQGITLNIPKGALDKESNIRMGILYEKQFVPKLDKGVALLSPVICCEPNGLTFNIEATLTLPHCAVNPTRNWKFAIKTSSVAMETITSNSKPVWKDFTLADPEQNITETTMEIKIKHFTLYSMIGWILGAEPAEKWVHLVAFTPFKDKNNCVEPRVYCVNHYAEAEQMEKRHSHDDLKPMKLLQNGGNVAVELGLKSHDWTILDEKNKELDYDSIWQNGWDRCKFEVQPTNGGTSVLLEIHCKQKNSNTGKKTLTAKVGKEKVLHLLFPKALHDFICQTLDREDKVHQKDWTQIAMHLNLKISEVIHLKDMKETARQSPTRNVLSQWKEKGLNIEQFEKLMVTVGIHNVAERIKKFRKGQPTNGSSDLRDSGYSTKESQKPGKSGNTKASPRASPKLSSNLGKKKLEEIEEKKRESIA